MQPSRSVANNSLDHVLYELHRCSSSINFRRLRHNPARGRDIMNSSNEARDGAADCVLATVGLAYSLHRHIVITSTTWQICERTTPRRVGKTTQRSYRLTGFCLEFQTVTRRVAMYLETYCNIGSNRAFPTGVLDRWHNCLLIYWRTTCLVPALNDT